MENKTNKSLSVTYSQPFSATIESQNGKKTIKIKSQQWYQHQLNKFKIGESVTLVIHNRKLKRTEQQNRYYWGVYLPIIAKERNEPNLDRLHELFKGLFLTEGVVEVLGRKVRMKGSTAELSIGKFCQYIMDIHHETEVEPPPTENWGLVSLKEGLRRS